MVTLAVLLAVRHVVGLAIARAERDRLVTAFEREPGYALLSTRIDLVDRDVHLHAMRDPRARDWRAVMSEAGVDPRDVVTHWTLYESLDPQLLLERAKDVLAPPATVELSLDGDVLHARGTAPHRWTARASTIAVAMPGIREFDAKELADPLLDEAQGLKRDLEQRSYDLSTPTRGIGNEPLPAVFDLAKQLDRVASSAGLFVRVRVIVSGDDSTTDEQKRVRGRELCSEFDALKLARVQCSAVVDPRTSPAGHVDNPRAVATFAVDLIEADSVTPSAR